MKEKNLRKYPKWLKEEYVERAMENLLITKHE